MRATVLAAAVVLALAAAAHVLRYLLLLINRTTLLHRTLPDHRFSLQFDQAQWAVTPGQSAVLYDGDVCLGGGIIDTGSTLTD